MTKEKWFFKKSKKEKPEEDILSKYKDKRYIQPEPGTPEWTKRIEQDIQDKKERESKGQLEALKEEIEELRGEKADQKGRMRDLEEKVEELEKQKRRAA